MKSSLPSRPVNTQSPAQTRPSEFSTAKPTQYSRSKSTVQSHLDPQNRDREPCKPVLDIRSNSTVQSSSAPRSLDRVLCKPTQDPHPKTTVQSRSLPQNLEVSPQTALNKANAKESGTPLLPPPPPEITLNSIAAIIRLQGQLRILQGIMSLWSEVEAVRNAPKTLEVLKEEYKAEVEDAVTDLSRSLGDVHELLWAGCGTEEACSVEKRAEEVLQRICEYYKFRRSMLKRCEAAAQDEEVKVNKQDRSKIEANKEAGKGVKTKKPRKDLTRYLSDANVRDLSDRLFEAVQNGLKCGDREHEDNEISNMKRQCFENIKNLQATLQN